MCASIIVACYYWTMMDSSGDRSQRNFYLHLYTALLMTLDIFVIKIPSIFLNFIHTALIVVFYLMYTWVLHSTGTATNLYVALDWERNYSLTLMYAFFGSMAAALLVGLYQMTCYESRVYLHRRWVSYRKRGDHSGDTDDGDGVHSVALL